MAQEKKAVDTDALFKLISESGILNPHVKLAALEGTAFKATDVKGGAGAAPAGVDVYISPAFIFFHNKE